MIPHVQLWETLFFLLLMRHTIHPLFFKLFRQYHHGKGMHKQQYHKAIFRWGRCDSVAEESETCDETSVGGWCGVSAIIIFGGWCTGPVYGNGGGWPKADRADRGSAERGVHWRCVRSEQESDHDQVGWQMCGCLRQQN